MLMRHEIISLLLQKKNKSHVIAALFCAMPLESIEETWPESTYSKKKKKSNNKSSERKRKVSPRVFGPLHFTFCSSSSHTSSPPLKLPAGIVWLRAEHTNNYTL